MKLYMLDTDIASYVIKATNSQLVVKVKAHKNEICISTITLAELLFGAAKRHSVRLTESIDALQNLVDVRPWTTDAAKQYAIIRQQLEMIGEPIGNMDLLIAASAQVEGAILITNNVAHFSRIENLKFENWLA